MRNSSFLLLLLSFSLSTGLRAQNNAGILAAQNDRNQQDSIGAILTLPQAVTIAIKNNLAVAQSDLSSQNYKIGFDQSWEYMLPTLSASGGQQINFGRTINSSNNNQYVSSQFSNGTSASMAAFSSSTGSSCRTTTRHSAMPITPAKWTCSSRKTISR